MKETTDYDIFGTHKSNREVDMRHVRRLAQEISKKNLLHLNPIIVDAGMAIIDGQHRLAAARLLGVSIFWEQDDTISKEDIAMLNSNKKNWAVMDYIKFHTEEGRAGFDVLSKFMADNPEMRATTAIKLLSSTGRRNTGDIREGRIDVDNLERAEQIASFCKWLYERYEYAYNDQVVSALRRVFYADGFDENYFRQKISGQPRSLTPVINAKQAEDMFVEIYNWRSSKNIIKL